MERIEEACVKKGIQTGLVSTNRLNEASCTCQKFKEVYMFEITFVALFYSMHMKHCFSRSRSSLYEQWSFLQVTLDMWAFNIFQLCHCLQLLHVQTQYFVIAFVVHGISSMFDLIFPQRTLQLTNRQMSATRSLPWQRTEMVLGQ